MTGMVPQSPQSFVANLMDFNRRREWDSMFDDGVVVEAIYLGESKAPDDSTSPGTPLSPKLIQVPDKQGTLNATPVRTTDDVNTFLQTVDVAGGKVIPFFI
jgi:hypothetical protein